MPTSAQLHEALGAGGARALVQNDLWVSAELERQSRLSRDSQATLSVVTARMSVSFGTDETAMVSDWHEFGNIAFTTQPAFSHGSAWVNQSGEPAVNADGTDIVFDEHLLVPCVAMQFRYKQDAQGLYRKAKVFAFALDVVPEGFMGEIDLTWIGMALRLG
jgi:hypothetical protein